MKSQPILLVFIFLSLIINACKKNDRNEIAPSPPPIQPPVKTFIDEKVTASLLGRVIDEQNQPLADAVVKAGGVTISSDSNGIFRFNNIQLGKIAGSVSAEKNGFFKNAKTFMTNPGITNYTEIRLLSKNNSGTFSSSSGGIVSIEGRGTVSFNENSIIDVSSGMLYSGTVVVKSRFIDITDSSKTSFRPGNLIGLDSMKQLQAVNSNNVIVIELENGSGQKLNIAPGKTATLSFPIGAPDIANAPLTVPLFYFNDTIGLWQRDGFLVKQSNNYVGTVSHFTYWDDGWHDLNPFPPSGPIIPIEFVTVGAGITDQNNNPLEYYKVRFTGPGDPDVWTDSTGHIALTVIKNAPYQIHVVNKCNDILFSKDIGIISSNVDLGAIKVNVPESGSVLISGSVSNCNHDIVAKGVVNITTPEGLILTYPIVDGKFSSNIERCQINPGSFKIIAIDTAEKQKTTTVTINASKGSYDAGEMIACTPVDENYVNLWVRLKNSQNTLLNNFKVQLIDQFTTSAMDGLTDSSGSIKFVVSKNTVLQLNVFDKCTNLAYSQNIGPFSSTTDLGYIIVDSVGGNSVNISGYVINHNLQPVNNGSVNIEFEGLNYTVSIVNGNFEFNGNKKICDGNETIAKITASDFQTGKQTASTELHVFPGTNICPAIIADDNSDEEYVRFLVNDTGYISFSEPPFSLGDRMTALSTFIDADLDVSQNASFEFMGQPGIPASTVGVWQLGYFTLAVNNKFYKEISSSVIKVNARRYGSLFDLISGSFSGVFLDVSNPNVPVKISCDFNVKTNQP